MVYWNQLYNDRSTRGPQGIPKISFTDLYKLFTVYDEKNNSPLQELRTDGRYIYPNGNRKQSTNEWFEQYINNLHNTI